MYIDQHYGHKPSCSVWKTMTKTGYAKRIALVFESFFKVDILSRVERMKNRRAFCSSVKQKCDEINFPGVSSADIGSGPWCGVFFLKSWQTMFAVDPVMDIYASQGLTKDIPGVVKIAQYAEKFKLPSKVDLMWSINALNHGGCLRDSLQNMMDQINDNGTLMFHIHLRTPEKCDNGHPMPILPEELDAFFKPYKTLSRDVLADPLKPGRAKAGRPTYLARIQKS